MRLDIGHGLRHHGTDRVRSVSACALIGNQVDGELVVQLDHVIKPFRDSQISTWLYGSGSAVFRRLGIDRISSERGTEAHNHYLTRNGFVRVDDRYVLTLSH